MFNRNTAKEVASHVVAHFCGYGLKIVSLDFLRNLQVTIFTHKSPTPDVYLRVNIYRVSIVKMISYYEQILGHNLFCFIIC